jgi:hypothetical protein
MSRRYAALAGLAIAAAACQPAVITVGGYPVACNGISMETCRRVAGLAINNMAWIRPTYGLIHANPRRSCPAVPDWADSSSCWQVYIPFRNGQVCMVVARGFDGHFGQVGGDQIAGPPSIRDKPPGCPP